MDRFRVSNKGAALSGKVCRFQVGQGHDMPLISTVVGPADGSLDGARLAGQRIS